MSEVNLIQASIEHLERVSRSNQIISGWNMNFRAKRNTASGKNGFNQKRNRREYG